MSLQARTAALCLVVLTASALPLAALRQPSRTIWDRVYTEAQATRGQTTYEKACLYCHLRDLSGGSEAAAPPLAGRRFLSRWDQRTLADLFVLMADTMPKNGQAVGGPAPVHVELEEYLDVVAYVLMFNGAPAGAMALPADEQLGNIVITQNPQGR